jgi:UTP:GlnB (protein PII) uridylyltransferase
MCLKRKISIEDLIASEDLSYQECPVKILKMSERVTQNKKIKMCKVQWSHRTEEEATWEREEELKAEFLNIFSNPFESQG